MSDAEEKRHEATPARRRRAQHEGNVARSSELTGIAAFGAAVVGAAIAAPLAVAAAASAVRQSAAHTATAGVPGGIMALVVAALVPASAAASAGAFTALAQNGGLHVMPPHVDLKRLDPVAGVKRMLGGEAVVAVLRGVLAFAAALAALVPVLRDIIAGAAALGSPGAAAALVASAALRACGAAFAVGAVFAVADYALARRRWLRGLRMSFEELKRDVKENDGDPHARARRKSVHRTIARGTVGRTREASFVVVNPTHVAVALRYAPPVVPVPEILVRAAGDAALRVRAIAREHRIPVVENVELARLLYAHGATGRAIPPETYVAVAHVVAALAREGVLS
ncbi:MAG TPA: EscU/YscU/HrcU family type III secretion system export apparatus switch protein [Candidatus Elarobacter sp.]|nr:EscU/YscU/HrcU family type III secretion system export apparatus switch protein [Candidatus Elarobacter sp.]